LLLQWETLSFAPEYYIEFSINAGYNTQFNQKNKMMLEFGIILHLMLIVSQHIGQKLDLMPRFGLKLI